MATKSLKTKEDGASVPLIEGSGEEGAPRHPMRGPGGRRERPLYKPPVEGPGERPLPPERSMRAPGGRREVGQYKPPVEGL